MSRADDNALRAFLAMRIATQIHVDRVDRLPNGTIQVWTQAFGQPKFFAGRGATDDEATTAVFAEVTAFVAGVTGA